MSGEPTVYQNQDLIPLAFRRQNPARTGYVTGLAPTVVVYNERTGAVLLASTPLTEKISASGIYTYDWNHNLPNGGSCIAVYTVGSQTFSEDFIVTYSNGGNAR